MITNPPHYLDNARRVAADRLDAFSDRVHIRWQYFVPPIGVGLLTLLIVPIRDSVSVQNALFLYLLLCFGFALWLGSGPAVLGALLSFLAFNFFLVHPVHTFRVAESDHAVALIAFLGVAIVTGQLVARVRSRTAIAEREQHRTALLYDLNAALIGGVNLESMLNTISAQLVQLYGAASCRIVQRDPSGAMMVRARYPVSLGVAIDRQRDALIQRAMDDGVVVGRSRTSRRVVPARPSRPEAGLMPGDELDTLYVPIRTATQTLGVLEVNGRPGGGRFHQDDEAVLTSFANQAALAVERANLVQQAANAAALAESDAFKTTLLAALSHDLRTPLAVIKASSSALIDDSIDWEPGARDDLMHAIDQEADRLDRLVGNLLDLTRLQGTVLQPNLAWYDISELVSDVVARPEFQRSQHQISVQAPDDLPLLRFDYVQMAQVLINLLENAIKYTPADSTITVGTFRANNRVHLTVADAGPGIAPADLPHVFEAFRRATTDARIPGSGIGLAICKGFTEANGGQITVRSVVGAGTTFTVSLPIDRPGTDDHG